MPKENNLIKKYKKNVIIKKQSPSKPSSNISKKELNLSLKRAIQENDLNKVTNYLQEGANANFKENISDWWSLLKIAYRQRQSKELIELLLQYGANPNDDALIFASEENQIEIVKCLLEHGADPNFSDGLYSPLQKACGTGSIEIINLLLANGANPNLKIHRALELASYCGHTRIVELLLNKEVSPRQHPQALLRACSKGYLEIVELLLLNGADPNARDDYRCASYMGYDALALACCEASNSPHLKNIVQLLLQYGADPNKGDALYHAARYENLEVMKILLENGANPKLYSITPFLYHYNKDITQIPRKTLKQIK